ncbi:MAG: hypothetical protein ACRC3H_16135 [Lachnospiraceae bacterium]
MSIIKSFSVGNGDMFYIKHGSDNFTTIDCCYDTDTDNKDEIFEDIKQQSKDKGITRFISTHPDDDHIRGLTEFCDKVGIVNFYCVENEAIKTDATDDFKKYCDLRDGDKHFYVYKGCSRKWMNINSEERGSAGISFLWPNTSNEKYKQALSLAKEGKSPNNISPIFRYSVQDGAKAMWMGDIENDFIESVKDDIDFEEVDILFAPHHGRDSGKTPSDILKKINPKVIIIGEAPSGNLNYYEGYNTITQNTAGDIIFDCTDNKIHIYVSNKNYSVDFLTNESKADNYGRYIGTIIL